jgi:uncharacterized membrane protein
MAKNDKALSGAASGAATGTAIMPGWGTAIGAVAGGLMGAMGDSASEGDQKRIEEAQARNLALYNNLLVPNQQVNYENLTEGVQLDPRLQVADQLQGRDNLQDINLDPRLAQAKMNSLEAMQKIAGGGFTPQELNALQEQRSNREADLTSKLKALQQNQDMRGVGNSDMALAQRMMEAQGSANRGAQDARSLQAQGMQRSMQAIIDGGNLANQYENTDYSRQGNLAQAKNARELTNFRETASVNQGNVDRFNNALANNVARSRSVADQNAGINNTQQDMRNTLAQRAFQNNVTKITGQSGANANDAAAAQNNINASNSQWGGLMSGAMQAGAAYMGSNDNDKKMANDLKIAQVKAGKG